MINNDEIKQEILKFIEEDGLKMMIGWYKKYKIPFPLIVEDGCPISTNLLYGMAIRNHIRKKFPQIDEEMDYNQYEDYIYNLIDNMLKEKIKEGY